VNGSSDHFELKIPGGGTGGVFNGCSGYPANGDPQFPLDAADWGSTMDGVADSASCSTLPTELQAGCATRFDFLFDSKPTATF
jgi:hypothetical protein